MSLSEMSETKSVIFKRNSDLEGSNIKRMRLDDDDSTDSDVLRSLTRAISSSSSSSLAYSVSDSGHYSAALSEEDDHRSLSSGCSSSETNEIASNTRLPYLDLQDHQISETEISTLITNNFRKQASPLSDEIVGETAEMDSATTERRDQRKSEKREKPPTQAELDDFFSAAERCQQKRFTDKYNYDVVNDTPLEGRYQWVSLKP